MYATFIEMEDNRLHRQLMISAYKYIQPSKTKEAMGEHRFFCFM